MMPHVKFRGDLDVKSAWRNAPAYRFSVAEEDLHIKFLESYAASSQEALLWRYVVVEGRLTQYVQVVLARSPDEWVLKLDRAYPILRTAGVKLLLATLAGWLEARGLALSSTNLEAYMSRGRFYAAHLTAESPIVEGEG